jgi:chemotaxis protein methyltransferase CheR
MLAAADLGFLIELVHRRSGIELTPDKSYLFEGRLMPLLRRHRLSDLADLLATLRKAPGEALVGAVVEAMATHESSFFRDIGIFEHLARTVLPALRRRRHAARRLRIWSAACAFGQEPISCAILLAEQEVDFSGWSIELIGSDLSCLAIERCQAGAYSDFEVGRGLTPERLGRWFSPVRAGWQIKEEIAARVAYRQHNLLDSDPRLGRFDVILLRNVLIYFDHSTRQRVMRGVRQHLADDGILILGGTEDAGALGVELEPCERRGFYQAGPATMAGNAKRLAAAP